MFWTHNYKSEQPPLYVCRELTDRDSAHACMSTIKVGVFGILHECVHASVFKGLASAPFSFHSTPYCARGLNEENVSGLMAGA